MAKNYKRSYKNLLETHKDLQSNSRRRFKEFQSTIDDLEKAIEVKSEKIADLNQLVKKERAEKQMYKNRLDFDACDDNIIKYILKSKAENKLIGRIHKGIQRDFDTQWDFEKIQRFMELSNLSTELQKYYYEQEKQYDEVRKMEDERERQNDLENINYLLNKMNIIVETADLTDTDDKRTFLKATREITKLIDTKKSLNKELNSDGFVMDEQVKKIKESLDKNMKDTFVIDDLSNVKVK